MSANNAIIHQIRLEDFKQNIEEFDNCTNHQQNRRAHNETINSSNLVMNQRDRQNVRDFLSANHSGVGRTGLELDGLSELNGHDGVNITKNAPMSSGFNPQNTASYP